MHEVTDLSGLITLREVALLVGQTPNAVYLHIRRHGIRTKRAGRTLLVRMQDLTGMRVTLGCASQLHQIVQRPLVELRGADTWNNE
jgi:hypothetical protein